MNFKNVYHARKACEMILERSPDHIFTNDILDGLMNRNFNTWFTAGRDARLAQVFIERVGPLTLLDAQPVAPIRRTAADADKGIDALKAMEALRAAETKLRAAEMKLVSTETALHEAERRNERLRALASELGAKIKTKEWLAHNLKPLQMVDGYVPICVVADFARRANTHAEDMLRKRLPEVWARMKLVKGINPNQPLKEYRALPLADAFTLWELLTSMDTRRINYPSKVGPRTRRAPPVKATENTLPEAQIVEETDVVFDESDFEPPAVQAPPAPVVEEPVEVAQQVGFFGRVKRFFSKAA